MTCIVGIEHDGGVTIGGDSIGATNDIKSARADAKVFRVGPYLFGFTNSFRMGQLLRYSLQPPKPKHTDLDRHMTTVFVDAVRTCLQAGGALQNQNGVEQVGGTFLVGIHGRLYQIDDDYQIARQHARHDACGAGEPIALGSLHTTALYDIAPKRRALLALEAAAAHSPYVAAPFVIKTVHA